LLLLDEEQIRETVNDTDADTADGTLVAALDATIGRYSRTIRQAIESVEGTGRLTIPQLRCLQMMATHADGSLTSQLARMLKVAVPTMTSMIDGLVERGMVERQPHPTDRRQVRLLLTTEGRHTLDRYRQITHDRLAEPLSQLDRGQKARLTAALADLNAILDDESPRDTRSSGSTDA